MSAYTIGALTRLLRQYVDIRSLLDGRAQPRHDDDAAAPAPTEQRRERPLGLGRNDPRPWPFMAPPHARPPRDGKARGRAREELHVSIVDVEQALAAADEDGHPRVSDEDVGLIYRYLVFQTHTLDELQLELGLKTRSHALYRIERAVRRLLMEIERTKCGPMKKGSTTTRKRLRASSPTR